MSHRRARTRIPVRLVLPPEPPTPEEIDAVLMAADAIIGKAGRSGLTLILAGSGSKRVLAKEWDQILEYGALSHLTAEVVGTKVDWCIHHKWLRVEYDTNGIPLLVHSPKGWERVKRLWVLRLFCQFEEWAERKDLMHIWLLLENIHRDIKLSLLATIVEKECRELATVLRAWFPYEVRKMRMAINEALEQLGYETLSHPKDHIDRDSP